MTLPNQEPVERWQDEFNSRFDYSIIDSVIRDMGDDATWLTMKKNIKAFISHQKALSRAEVLEEVRGKIEKQITHKHPEFYIKKRKHEYCIECGITKGTPHEPDCDSMIEYHHNSALQRLSDTLAVVDELEGKKYSDKDWEMLHDAKKQSQEFENRRGE